MHEVHKRFCGWSSAYGSARVESGYCDDMHTLDSRTEAYVYDRVRRMLETEDVSRLTVARVAVQCSISRRTLETHWRSLPELLHGGFIHFYIPMAASATAEDPNERLEQALLHIRSVLDSHLTRAAIFVADETGDAKRSIFELWRHELTALVRPFTVEEFTELVGPMAMEMLAFGKVTHLTSIRRSVVAALR